METQNENAQYRKMTETPVASLVVSLGIPTTISMLVTSIYNMADTAFVGTLGTSASGAIGIVFGYMAILQAIGFMFGQGSGSQIAQPLADVLTAVTSIPFVIYFFRHLPQGEKPV